MFHQLPMVQKKADGLGIGTSKKEAWYLRECRKVDHEGKWLEIFHVRTYVIHLLGTYVTILCNWLIL